MIYFIRNADRSAIKIGTTIHLSTRLQQLAAEHGELEVLAVLDGGRDEEHALHHRFDSLRTVGEWFEPGDDLMGFIVAEGKPWNGSDPVTRKPIRLDVSPPDYDRAAICAEARGLTLSSYARMAVLDFIKRDEREAAAE